MRPLVRFVLVISVASALLAAGLGALSIPYREVTSDLWLAKATKLGELTELSQPSVVFDRNGAFLTMLKAEENRKPMALSAIGLRFSSAFSSVRKAPLRSKTTDGWDSSVSSPSLVALASHRSEVTSL